MKYALFLALCFFAASCGKQINDKNDSFISTSSFELAFHQSIGSCDSLPIRHRVLNFPYIALVSTGTDQFYARIEISLDEDTQVYTAFYKEFAFASNTIQANFETTLHGSYSFESSDKIILNNLGQLSPSLKSDKEEFSLSLFNPLNLPLKSAIVLGTVSLKSSVLYPDNCI